MATRVFIRHLSKIREYGEYGRSSSMGHFIVEFYATQAGHSAPYANTAMAGPRPGLCSQPPWS